MTSGQAARAWGRAATAFVAVSLAWCAPARADTLLGALAQSYEVNPQLNSQRAIVRQTDEGVPQALAGYRPHLNGTASIGNQFTWTDVRGQRNTDWTSPRS